MSNLSECMTLAIYLSQPKLSKGKKQLPSAVLKSGGYIKTAKTENSPFFDSDRNFFVSKIVRKTEFSSFSAS